MKTFKQFLESKKSKLRLTMTDEGEPAVVGGKKPKKGKLKLTLNDEGEAVVENHQ